MSSMPAQIQSFVEVGVLKTTTTSRALIAHEVRAGVKRIDEGLADVRIAAVPESARTRALPACLDVSDSFEVLEAALLRVAQRIRSHE